MDLSSSKGGDSHCIEFAHGSLLFSRSKSRKGGCALFEYSKPYVLFSTTNAASAAIDFSRKNVDDVVVDSPPSQGLWWSPVLSTSPLEGCHCIEGRHRSPSLGPPSSRMPHRQLYKRCMDNILRNASVHLHIHCSSILVCIYIHAVHLGCTTVDHL